MRFQDYQDKAAKTDQVPGSGRDTKALMVPLLGLAGEAGSLLTEYKKWLVEGSAYQIFKDRIGEELGDLLWYIANIASKEGLSLETIAKENLEKAQSRWLPADEGPSCYLRVFDQGFPPKQQLPRTFRIEMFGAEKGGKTKVHMAMNGKPLGDGLTDNAYEEDGYRYHDIFHLSYAAVLGWSPVIRKLMNRKRKDDLKIDEIEDGGRATAIEEGISALVFDYARDHSFLEGVERVDFGILRMIKQLTRSLEVADRSEFQWEDAILKGFSVWRKFRQYSKGMLVGDLNGRTIEFEKLPDIHRSRKRSRSKVSAISPGHRAGATMRSKKRPIPRRKPR